MWCFNVYPVSFPCLISSELQKFSFGNVFRELGDEWLAHGRSQGFSKGGHTDSYRGYSSDCHLNIVGCLLTKRLTKGGSWAPQDPPWLRPLGNCFHTINFASYQVSTYVSIVKQIPRIFSISQAFHSVEAKFLKQTHGDDIFKHRQ